MNTKNTFVFQPQSCGKVTRLENYVGGQQWAKAENETFSAWLHGKTWLRFVTSAIYNLGK